MAAESITKGETAWVTVCGERDAELSRKLTEKVAALRAAGKFREADQLHIQKLSFSITRDGFVTSPERVEQLRRLCQLYSADVRPPTPTSHRRIIGPFIVFAKKIFRPIMQAVFGPAFRTQRDFNAVVVALLTDLCNESIPRKNKN